MARLLTVLSTAGFAAAFWLVPLLRLFDAFQPMITALSIIAAAILVRLNRGMPTLEWKSLDALERSQITSKIVDLSREYAFFLGFVACALGGLVALTVVGKDEIKSDWPVFAQHLTTCLLGAMVGLSAARMGYVVWRDYDIVSLQKVLVDKTASREALDSEVAQAAEKVTDIRASGLRRLPPGEVRSLGDD